MDVQDLVVKISGSDNQEETLLGGKANSLNKMIQAGFPVPPAWCVTVPAYKQFLAEAKPASSGNKAVQTAISQADIPEVIKQGIIEAYNNLGNNNLGNNNLGNNNLDSNNLGNNIAVAVRSSAIGEDSEASLLPANTTLSCMSKVRMLSFRKSRRAGVPCMLTGFRVITIPTKHRVIPLLLLSFRK